MAREKKNSQQGLNFNHNDEASLSPPVLLLLGLFSSNFFSQSHSNQLINLVLVIEHFLVLYKLQLSVVI